MRYNLPKTADSEKDIQALKAIGRVCAETLRKMMRQTRALLDATKAVLAKTLHAVAAQFEHTIIVIKNEPIILIPSAS